jgi:hypothetical protein
MNGKQATISQYVGGFTSPLSSECVTRDKDKLTVSLGCMGGFTRKYSIAPKNA